MSLNPTMIFTAAEIRDGKGLAIGTGFIMSVQSETNPINRWPYILTAHHVIRGESSIWVASADPNGSGELYEPEEINDWHQPVDGLDLAVAPWPYKEGVPYSSVNMEKNLLGEERISLLGAPIHYIGLFAPAKRMMARSGTFGAIDAHGIGHDPGPPEAPYDPSYVYDCHLIDCRSYGGFSGSPCFVELLFIQKTKGRNDEEVFTPLYRALMCGMFTEHYDDSDDPKLNPDGAVSRYGVGVMVRGEDIKTALLSDEMKNDRLSREAALASETLGPSVGPRAAKAAPQDSDAQGDSLGATRQLLGEVLAVTKDDIDEVHRGHS